MSVTLHNAHQLPQATRSVVAQAGHVISPTPSSTRLPYYGALPSTPPSSSNAQLLAGMNPTTSSFLSGVADAGVASHVEAESTGGDATPLPPTSPAATASDEDALRGIYGEKLRASVHSIVATLTAELPEDHIFRQLLADPTTQQYCKVRLAEVVEGFLYSTQAEQFHTIATELARCERDCAAQQNRVEELEAALAAATALSRSPSDGMYHPPHHAAVPWLLSPSSAAASAARPAARTAGAAATTSPTFASVAVNPMEDEEARRELLRILDQATHDQELHRCAAALHAVARVVGATTGDQPNRDAYGSLADLLDELYACTQSLLSYVDGALESQERLRLELEAEQQRWPFSLASHSASANDATATAAVSGAGAPIASAYNTPQRPQVRLGGTAPAPPSSASSHTRPIQSQRERLHRLAERLREGQQHANQVLEGLAQAEATRRREAAQLARAVATAKEEAAAAAADAQMLSERAERLRHEHAASAASERTELRDRLADAQARLAAAVHDVHEAERERHSAASRAEAAEEREVRWKADLAALTTTLARRDTEVRERQGELAAQRAELTALTAAHQRATDAVQDAARELLCLRVERTMSGLSAVYHEAKAAKAEAMERDGYRVLSYTHCTAVAAQREAVRQAEMHLQLAESVQVEQAVAERGCVDALGVLLHAMWTDDAVELALAPSTTTARESVVDGGTPAQRLRQRRRSSGSNAGTSGAAASTSHTTAAATSASPPAGRLPSTLSGLCAALRSAYDAVRARHHATQQTVDSLRASLASRDIELSAAHASEAQLRELLKAEQAKEERWRAEMAQLTDHNPMRGLLARQDALLRAVSDERNELRRLWNQLSGDYIALEQRNGVLHARCATKEHENARLSGMLRRGDAPPGTTAVPPTAARASPPTSAHGDGDDAAAPSPPPSPRRPPSR
ncbi:hypothetical protein NESM_000737900 [Novymonas esmeraldas]|uniref:Uncharacterized protein n=1 Tax=Novymonas esmeraldas TaxID=1808958 RepID=A0AAW0EVS5_9TRYP